MAEKKTRKEKQVSLASAVGATQKKKKKKKASTGTVIIRVMVVILVVLSLIFIGVIAYGVVSSFSSGGRAHDVTLSSYDTTPQAQESKVSYFLVGMTGKDESAAMDMLTLVCYDKREKSVQLLQMPVDTYVGRPGAYTVTRIGNIWNNPTPLTWCETCRRRVFEPEQENGKHTTCGTALTQKTGSAVESLLSVFNDQYSMPVDNYFILSQNTLVQMIDLLGGVDVELETALKVGDVNYPKGKAVLDGKAALYYAHEYDYNATPAKDLERLLRQRRVWTSVLQRLTAMEENKLAESVIGPVMTGADPMRTNTDSSAVAKMLAGIQSGSTENVTFARATAKLLHSLQKADLSKSAFFILPGQIAKQGTATYYSVSRADTLKLLQDTFNPYGLELKEDHLQITELVTQGGKTDTKTQTLSQLAVEQSAATTATTAAATTAQ